MDREGYIIAHDDMVIPPRKKYKIPNIMNMHITRKLSILKLHLFSAIGRAGRS